MGVATEVSARASRVAVVLALVGVIASSIFSLTAWDQGWAKVCKENLQTETSPYANMMKYLLIRYPDKDGLTIDFVSAIEFQLPDPESTVFRVKLQLGLMRLKNTVWITESDPVPGHIKVMAKNLAPVRFQDNVEQIFGEHRSALLEEYDGDRTGAKIVGSITAASLIMSALLAFLVLLGCIACRWGPVPKYAEKIALWSHLIGVATLCVICIEYVALAIGTHRDSKDNPVLMKGYVPTPDYGWYCAVLSSIFWLGIWGALRRDPYIMEINTKDETKSHLPTVGIPFEDTKLEKVEAGKEIP